MGGKVSLKQLDDVFVPVLVPANHIQRLPASLILSFFIRACFEKQPNDIYIPLRSSFVQQYPPGPFILNLFISACFEKQPY